MHAFDAPTDRPFALPAASREIAIDLPFPPSTNRLHGRSASSRKYFRRSKYESWLSNADAMVTLHGSYPRPKLDGKFEATLLFDEGAGKNSDLDNRIKATLDWVVSREVVTDDRYCRRLVAQWVPHERAPYGCKLILRSWHG